jgi:hypothetical protein
MYKVVKFFTDLQDHDYPYHVGDIFPHSGMVVDEKRIIELSTDANRRNEPLIEEVKENVQEESKEPTEEQIDDFAQYMNPPIEEVVEKPKKKRGRPRNDAE